MTPGRRPRLLVVGGSGVLGHAALRAAPASLDCVGTFTAHPFALPGVLTRKFDLATDDPVALLDAVRPDAVLLSGAMTTVDACERDPELATLVNAVGPGRLAEACNARDLPLVHVSTDYVFDGKKGEPYVEGDDPAPVNAYARSKLEGERAVLAAHPGAAVARVAVVFGWNRVWEKANFVTWALEGLRKGRPIKALTDQATTPTYADACGRNLLALLESRRRGVWHLAGADCVDRYTAALSVADVFGLDRSLVEPATSDSIEWVAPRPRRTCLDSRRAERELGLRPPPLRASLEDMRAREHVGR